MTVYVDNMSDYPMGQFRRMKMSHMIADTEDELHEMAKAIGVARKWYQGDHYDICLSKKAKAIKLGAKLIDTRQLAAMAYLQRCGHSMGDPETAEERMLTAKRVKRRMQVES